MRLVPMLAATALLLGTPPVAGAAPRRAVLTDGFTMRGTAGEQAVVRVPRTLKIPSLGNGITLHAGIGAFAGFALVRHGVKEPSRSRFAYAVAGTPEWACGTSTCDLSAHGFTYGGELPKGDYVLVLLGERGAKVQVTVDPVARGRRPAVVTPTARSTPLVAPAEGPVPDLPAEPYAFGSFETPGSGVGLVGLLHTSDLAVGDTSVDFGVGWGGADGCDDRHWSGARGDLGRGHRTTAIAAPSDAGITATCGSWEGIVTGAGAQRALGFYVPIVAR